MKATLVKQTAPSLKRNKNLFLYLIGNIIHLVDRSVLNTSPGLLFLLCLFLENHELGTFLGR